MTVTALERLRYHVTSRTGKPPYLVDIGSYRRHGVCLGKCTCEHFSMVLFPEVRKLVFMERSGGKKFIPSDRHRCAHILAARKHGYDELLDMMVNQFRKQFDDYSDEEDAI